jgi:hypothetical protein
MTTPTKAFTDIPTEATTEAIRAWMRDIGFVHASEIEEATSTVSRTRARWKSLRPVYFGKEAYYRLTDIKRHLDSRADQSVDTAELVSL